MMQSLKVLLSSKTFPRCSSRILNLNLLPHYQTQTRSFSSSSVAAVSTPITESTVLQAIESSQRHFIEHLAPHLTPSTLSSSLASFDLTTRCHAVSLLYHLPYPKPVVHSLLHPIILTGAASPGSIIEELSRARERLNVDSTGVFDALVRAYCKLEKPDEALECFYLMKEKGVLPKTETCNDLLMLLLKSNRTQAEEFMKHMETLGIKPLIYTYEAKFQGKFEAVCVIFQRMTDTGLYLDAYSTNDFIFGIYKEGRFEELASPESEMLELGSVPHAVTYDALIHECVRNYERYSLEEIEKAVAYKDEMISRGIEPSLVTYNLLMYAWFDYGDTDEANDLIKEMQEKGMEADVYTYNTMITGNFIRKRLDCWLYDEMVGKGIQPTVVTYNNVMLGLCRYCGKMEEARKLFDEMKTRGFKPDHISYNLLIAGYSLQRGDVKEGLRLRDEMLKMGVDPTVTTYRALVLGLLDHHELEHIEELLKEMVCKGICTPHDRIYQYFTEVVKEKKENVDE